MVRASRDERLRQALRRSEIFFPYFDARVHYDDRRTRALLHGSGIEPAPLDEYFDRLIAFAMAAEWGKRELLAGGARARTPAGPPPPARGGSRAVAAAKPTAPLFA